MIDSDHVRERIAGLLYDGILSPLDWYAAMDAVSNVLGARLFHFFTLSNVDSTIVDGVDNQGLTGVTAENMREYVDHHVTSDIRMTTLMGMSLGEIMLDHERITAREMSRNVVYSDFLSPLGFGGTLGVKLRDDDGSRDFMGFIRPSDHHQYGADEKLFIEQLMPTLIRASRIRARMNALSRQASLGIAALETLVQGIAVVDAQCRIHYANPAAERLMTPPSAVSVVQQRLRCADAELQARLEQLATLACGNPGKAGGGGYIVELRASGPNGGDGAAAQIKPSAGIKLAKADGAGDPHHSRRGKRTRPSAGQRHAGAVAYRGAFAAVAGGWQIGEGLCAGGGLQLAHRACAHEEPDAQDRLPSASGTGATAAGLAGGVIDHA